MELFNDQEASIADFKHALAPYWCFRDADFVDLQRTVEEPIVVTWKYQEVLMNEISSWHSE